MKTREKLQTKLEECRQALAIHGGVLNLCAASLAIRLSRLQIPSRRLRCRIYRTIYGKKYPPLDESELEQPIGSYSSFNALFTRGVRPELRPIAESSNQLLCPCDGRVQDTGRIRDGNIMIVKGIEYTLGSLLPGIDTDVFRNGRYAIIFLSPSDCHRVFSPQDGHCHKIVHVPGSRLLVHPPFQRKEYPVFTLNERVILRLSTPLGACALVLVAGWGVGNITLPRDRTFRARPGHLTCRAYTPPLSVRKGEWVATFELGSTAILITELAKGVSMDIAIDDKVKYGQPAFSYDRS